jgi:hypothetical protein
MHAACRRPERSAGRSSLSVGLSPCAAYRGSLQRPGGPLVSYSITTTYYGPLEGRSIHRICHKSTLYVAHASGELRGPDFGGG